MTGRDADGYTCSACGPEYPLADGVPDFWPDDADATKGRGQRLMESERMVRLYESRLWRRCPLWKPFMGVTFDEELAIIERILGLGADETILDLACGPGLYARAFAAGSPDRTVIGLDRSRPMLRYAVKKARLLGLANLAFLHGDAHALPLADASVTAANCCGALHLFDEPRRVLAELARVIVPGGRFSAAAIWVGTKWWTRWKARNNARYWGIHHFTADELTGLLDQAGFEPTVHHAKGVWIIVGGLRRGQ